MFSRTTHCGFGVQPTDVPLRCKEHICLGGTLLTLTKCLLRAGLPGGVNPVTRDVLKDTVRRKVTEMSKESRVTLVFVNTIPSSQFQVI